MSGSATPVIELKGVSKRFGKTLDTAAKVVRGFRRRFGHETPSQVVHAVDNVDLVVRRGEVVGLVGESGCGKSTLGRMVAGIMPPSDGLVLFEGQDIAAMNPSESKVAKLKVQMIFQDPYASLNPRLRVDEIVGEAPRVHGLVPAGGYNAYVDAQFRRAGLDPAYKRRYPHQFSGGQRQRISIARAVVLEPSFIVLDEPTSALDMLLQAQMVDLLRDLQRKRDLTYMFISHDLRVVASLASHLIVMRHGKVVEEGPASELFKNPKTDYTRALFAAAFRLETANGAGDVDG
jgi:peptide/nickel transport system ATP-binding protein